VSEILVMTANGIASVALAVLAWLKFELTLAWAPLDHRARGGGLARSRVGLHDRDELRAAGGGGGSEAAKGDTGARGREGVGAGYERLPERKRQPDGAA
jgi:hypothetical protein